MTVMFADVKGSMGLSGSVDVEQWWSIMRRFFELLAQGVERFEGRVDRFTGDGMMAVFGAPHALENHAQEACRAALWLHDTVAAYAEELQRERGLAFEVRIGLNSGEVVAGTLGGDLSAEYIAIGHTAGLAQRMEALAEPGGVLLTETTARLVRGYFLVHERGAMEVKGVSAPVRVFELAGAHESRTAFEMSLARGLSRFVGRERELAVLERALEGTLEGDGRAVAVVGEAGVGKTRLCHEFIERCQAAHIPVWQAHAFAHLRTVPFAPILELVRDFFDIAQADEDALARAKVIARLEGVAEGWQDAEHLLLDFLGISDPAAQAPHVDPEARQRRLFAILNRLLTAGRDPSPAVILLEDMHWIDPASAAFVAGLAPALEGTRTLLLTTSREGGHPWTQGRKAGEVRLRALGRDASELLVDRMLGDDPSLDGVAALVYRHAEGNPFFLEEIVKTLAEGGTLEGTRGNYTLTRTIDEIEIPATVQSVLAARIDRLQQREKRVLQTAAVIGREFSESVLARVAGVEPQELHEDLRGLLAAELILPRSAPGEYGFRHSLAERVAYRSQLADSRALSHAAVAEALVELNPDRLDELAALIAHHWERAGDWMNAAQWSARAAGWAGFNDPREALRQWRKARELVDAAPDSPQRAQLGLGTRVMILNLTWRLGVPDGVSREQFERETSRLYEDAVELAGVAHNNVAETVAVAAYGAVRGMAGRLEEMADLGMRAVRLAEAHSDHPLMLSVLPCAVYGLHGMGRFPEILELLGAMSESFPQRPAEVVGVTMVCPYAWILCWQAAARAHTGNLPEAFAGFERAHVIASEREDSETQAQIHFSIVQAMQLAAGGDPLPTSRSASQALTHAEQAQRVVERSGGAFLLGHAWRYLGIAHLLGAEWGESIEAIQQALATWRPRRVGLEAEPHALTILARAQLGQGDTEAACMTAQEAVTLAMTRHTRSHELEARLALLQALRCSSGRGAASAAEGHIRRARSLLAETGARTLAGRIHVEVAELARLRGDDATYESESTLAREAFLAVGALALSESDRGSPERPRGVAAP